MHISKPARMNIPLRNLLRVRKKMASSEEIDYRDEDLEIVFSYCLFELKPVGVNRYFVMIAIHQRLSQNLKMEISSKIIWDYLDTLYDMTALHDSEIIPFPNDQVDFELPEDFGDILKEKFGVTLQKTVADEELSKNGSNGKPAKKIAVSKLKQNTPADSKNSFVTPTPLKSAKTNADSRPPSNENSTKKLDSKVESKFGKVRRSSSPFTPRNAKTESSTKEENNETPSSKKSAKVEPVASNVRKSIKAENNSTPVNSKTSKQETSNAKPLKAEILESGSKRNKSERESLKKGRHSSASESSVKKLNKVDNKREIVGSKRLSDSNKLKLDKSSNSSKAAKMEEDSQHITGTRKHSLGKVDTNDKKRKRLRTEDLGKKSLPTPNRRRT